MQNKEEKLRMFGLIEEWQNSGGSQIAYCRESGLAYHRFHYWYKRYKAEQQTSEAVPPSAFVALHVKPAATISTPYAELLLPCGKRLVFHQPVEASLLQALLH